MYQLKLIQLTFNPAQNIYPPSGPTAFFLFIALSMAFTYSLQTKPTKPLFYEILSTGSLGYSLFSNLSK